MQRRGQARSASVDTHSKLNFKSQVSQLFNQSFKAYSGVLIENQLNQYSLNLTHDRVLINFSHKTAYVTMDVIQNSSILLCLT